MHIFKFYHSDSSIHSLQLYWSIYFTQSSFQDLKKSFWIPLSSDANSMLLQPQTLTLQFSSDQIRSDQSQDRSVCMSAEEQLKECRNRAYGVSRYHPCLIIQVINQGSVVLINSLLHTQSGVPVCLRGCLRAWQRGTRWDWWVPHGVYILLHVLIKT